MSFAGFLTPIAAKAVHRQPTATVGNLDGKQPSTLGVAVMVLTDTAIKNTKPQGNAIKFSDERGLYLLLNPNGSRWWRLDCRLRQEKWNPDGDLLLSRHQL